MATPTKRSISDVNEAEASVAKKARTKAHKLVFILTPKVFPRVRKFLDLEDYTEALDDYATVYLYTVGSAAPKLNVEKTLVDLWEEYDPSQAHPDCIADVPPFKLILDYFATTQIKKPPSVLDNSIQAAPRSDLGKWKKMLTIEPTKLLKNGPYDAIYMAYYDPAVYELEKNQ